MENCQTKQSASPHEMICELCRIFYSQGWASGTGGGVSVRENDFVYMAPSGVQKERLTPEDIFQLSLNGEIVTPPVTKGLKLSQCAPLFMAVYDLRGAGAVLHSHSMNSVLATLIDENATEFKITSMEMIKGIQGMGFSDQLVIPIIENTEFERDLANELRRAITAYPETQAVLVRRHGVYIWGRDWAHAKTQAECYDYLFDAAVKLKQLGVDPAKPVRAAKPRRVDSGLVDVWP